MTDRIFPTKIPSLDPVPSKIPPSTARPIYRPPSPPRRRRSCCCSLCLWLTFLFGILIFLIALAGAIFYAIYRPHRPEFQVTSLRVSRFNATSSTRVYFVANLTLSAKNPNAKIHYSCGPTILSVESSGALIGSGSFGPFDLGSKNTTLLRSAITGSGELDSGTVDSIRSDLKEKRGALLVIRLDSRVSGEIWSLKTKKVRIRVLCEGMHASAPMKNVSWTAASGGGKCKVDVKVKIWKWTF